MHFLGKVISKHHHKSIMKYKDCLGELYKANPVYRFPIP